MENNLSEIKSTIKESRDEVERVTSGDIETLTKQVAMYHERTSQENESLKEQYNEQAGNIKNLKSLLIFIKPGWDYFYKAAVLSEYSKSEYKNMPSTKEILEELKRVIRE